MHFANSGTEANEAALKLARKAKPRRRRSSPCSRGFHGRTYGVAVGHAAGEQAGAVRAARARASSPSSRPPRRSRRAVDDRTAAVLLEPVQGESGVYVLPDELLRAARGGVRRSTARR